jgi:hypothetical protein
LWAPERAARWATLCGCLTRLGPRENREWRWRESNPLNRPCSRGSVATVQRFRATRARAGPPWTSGCRGFVPASPRHQRANPTSSKAGALQALLRVAVEAATYIHLYSCGLYRCLSARPLTPPHGATRVGRRVRAVRIDQGQSRPRGRIRRRPRRGPGASRVVTTLPRKRSSTPCSTAPSRSTRTTSSAKSTRSNEDVDRITRPATTSHRRAMCPLGSSCVHIGTAACAYVYGVAGVGTD